MDSTGKLPPILIVGAHTMGLALLRAFKDMDIERIFISFDQDDMGRVSRYATKVIDSPDPESCADEFLELLIKLAKTYPGAVLFPASDTSLKAISMKKEVLSEYYIVACPEWAIVELIIDKKRTYEIAEKTGVPYPKTLLPCSEEEIEQYLQGLDFPCLVKPTQSHLYFRRFRRKMVLANDPDELMKAYRQAVACGLEVVFQEFIPGDDSNGVNYNSYAIDGKVRVEFTARKIRSAPPGLGSPCVARSAEISEIYELGRKIVAGLGFYGYSCTEFKMDQRTGIYKLMEVNGRHNLSGLLAVYCGLNFPEMHYKHLVLGEIPSQPRYKEGKYWIDLSRDFAYHFPWIIKGKNSISQYLLPYRADHIYAIYDTKDIGPFFKRTGTLVRHFFNHKVTL